RWESVAWWISVNRSLKCLAPPPLPNPSPARGEGRYTSQAFGFVIQPESSAVKAPLPRSERGRGERKALTPAFALPHTYVRRTPGAHSAYEPVGRTGTIQRSSAPGKYGVCSSSLRPPCTRQRLPGT